MDLGAVFQRYGLPNLSEIEFQFSCHYVLSPKACIIMFVIIVGNAAIDRSRTSLPPSSWPGLSRPPRITTADADPGWAGIKPAMTVEGVSSQSQIALTPEQWPLSWKRMLDDLLHHRR